jgi:integrase
MRAGEVTGLRWCQVDLQKGIIDLSAEDTKTDEPRLIYLNALPELRKVFIEAALKQRVGKGFVFKQPDGLAIPVWALRRPFLKACKEAKVGPYRFHDLRHSFNTNMIKAGVKKSVIMKLTGHKNRLRHMA